MSQPGPTDLLTAAIRDATSTLARVEPAALGRPTPCSEWTLRDLLQHMAAVPSCPSALPAGSRSPDFPETSADLLGGRPAETLTDLLAESAAAWQRADADPSAPCTTPIGVMPGSGLVTFQAQDVFVHTWDPRPGHRAPPGFRPPAHRDHARPAQADHHRRLPRHALRPCHPRGERRNRPGQAGRLPRPAPVTTAMSPSGAAGQQRFWRLAQPLLIRPASPPPP